jgi:hypothetical protein
MMVRVVNPDVPDLARLFRLRRSQNDESEKYKGQQRAKADSDNALVNFFHLVIGHIAPSSDRTDDQDTPSAVAGATHPENKRSPFLLGTGSRGDATGRTGTCGVASSWVPRNS